MQFPDMEAGGVAYDLPAEPWQTQVPSHGLFPLWASLSTYRLPAISCKAQTILHFIGHSGSIILSSIKEKGQAIHPAWPLRLLTPSGRWHFSLSCWLQWHRFERHDSLLASRRQSHLLLAVRQDFLGSSLKQASIVQFLVLMEKLSLLGVQSLAGLCTHNHDGHGLEEKMFFHGRLPLKFTHALNLRLLYHVDAETRCLAAFQSKLTCGRC